MTSLSPPERAAELFEAAIGWLSETYEQHRFFVERDVVHAVQLQLWDRIRDEQLDWSVFNDYPMLRGPRRAFSADLAMRSNDGEVLLAAEFKYEPVHHRHDLLAHKLPVIGWADALRDIERIRDFVTTGTVPVAYAIVIDEGGYFRGRRPHPHSRWIDWRASSQQDSATSVLWSRWPPAT